MNNVLDKLGIHDLFGMIVPGIIVTVEFLYLLPSFCESIIKEYISGVVGYFFFFFVAYLVGLVLHEIGTMMDEKKGLYRNDFLNGCGDKYVFNNQLDFQIANALKDNILRTCNLENMIDSNDNNKVCTETRFIYNYCISYSEMHEINSKTDKMQSISEMSRSLFWGNVICAIAYLFGTLLLYDPQAEVLCYTEEIIKTIVLIGLCILFRLRSIRYRKYRIKSLIRTCFISIYERNRGCVP